MQLVIAEKPSVARDLARVLGVRANGQHAYEGDRVVITWCIGHLVELEEPAAYDERWKVWRLETLPMLPDEIRLRASKHAKPQLKAVAALLRDRRFRGVVNACDAGREGELIFRYVYQWARSSLPVQRLWVSSLTDEAVRRGFAALRPGAQLEPLADAARSRSEADWLVGMNATRAFTVASRRVGHSALYSIGRVQTPTLAMICEREREIREFVPVPYWEVRGDFAGGVVARWRLGKVSRLPSEQVAGAIAARDAAIGGGVVVKVQQKVVREPPPMLFDLTSLQRTANKRYGFAAAKTLEVAQALYERHKVLTYPRTDSRHLSSDLVGELPARWEALERLPDVGGFAAQLRARWPFPVSKRVVDDTKVSDHHAIIPTGKVVELAGDERKIFDLVVRRFLGVFFPDAESAHAEAWVQVGAGVFVKPLDGAETVAALPPPPDLYVARGKVRLVAGWMEVAGWQEKPDEDSRPLPPLTEGQRLAGTFAPVAKKTTPPPRYTEATLLGAMESAGKMVDDEALREAMKERGLGTPATRAAVIETLIARDYIVRDKQMLVPTAVGAGLIAALPVPTLASPELTGAWEARLSAIAKGGDSRARFMADIAAYVREMVDAICRASLPPPDPSMPQPAPPRRGKGRGASRGKGRRARVARPRVAAAPKAPATILTCPACKAGTLVSGKRGWGCDRWRDGCRFVVWFVTGGRKLTRSQLVDLVTKGKTRKGQFVDASGRNIQARIVLDGLSARLDSS